VRLVSPTPALPGDPPVAVQWAIPPEYRLWPTLTAPAAPVGGGSETTVIRTAAVAGCGYAAAAVVLGLAVALAGRRPVALAGAVAVLGCAAWLAPEAATPLVRPALLVGLAGLLVLVVRGGRTAQSAAVVPPSARARLPSTASLGPAAALLLAVAGVGVAQAPDPGTVFVGEATRRATEPERAALKEIAARMDASRSDPAAFLALDAEFNQALVDAARNEYVATTMKQLQGASRRFWFANYERVANLPETARLHAALARAIASGSEAKAAKCLSDLLDNVEAFTRATLDH